MALVSEVKYETGIKDLEDISPESVLSMLQDARIDIGKIDSSFADVDLARVLAVVEVGEYKVNGIVSTRIDLSSAKGVIKAYRKYSEGGCKSCTSLGRETTNAQDAESGWYCQVSDPDYDPKAIGKPKVKYSGFSPKVNKHYDAPCGDDWTPRFSPELEKLIVEEPSPGTN